MKVALILIFLWFSSQILSMSTITFYPNGLIERHQLKLPDQENKSSKTYEEGFIGIVKYLYSDFNSELILGDYKRGRIFNTSSWPLRVIGQIDTLCTGTLIGPFHILTAAHCLYHFGDQKWLTSSSFSAGRIAIDQSPYGNVRWVKGHLLEGYINSGEVQYDFAVLELERRIGDQIGWHGYGHNANLQSGQEVIITGYPIDKEAGSMWEVKCPIEPLEEQITYRCDTFKGMSGSALRFIQENGKELINGLHTFGTPSLNGGIRITPHVFNIIKAWKYGQSVTRDLSHINTSPRKNFNRLIFKNDCRETIWTALHFKNLKNAWKTKGWWKLAPGEKAFVATTRHPIYYIYGESINHFRWEGSDLQLKVRGQGPYSFLKRRISLNQWGVWTQRFSCD